MRVLTRISQLLLPLVLVVASSIAWSQIAEDPGSSGGGLSPQASNPNSLSGVVVNSITGQPISRALVQIGEHAALTGHDGRFEFENVTEGAGAPTVSKPGYFPKDNGVPPQNQPIVLELIPEAIVSGTITDANGQPIQDLRIQLKMLQPRIGLSHWQQIQSTTTNVEGEFRFAGLEAGKYSLATSFHVEGLPEAASSVAFVPTIYPPLQGDGSSGALTLKPGDHIEAQLDPPVEKLYAVTGIVSGPPARGAGFQVETGDGEMVNPPTRFNRESGTFRMMLPSGSYRLILHSAVEGAQLIGIQEISVGHAPLEGVTVNLSPQASIPVEVEFQAVDTGSQDTKDTDPRLVNLFLQDNDSAGPMRIFSTLQKRVIDEQVNDSGPMVIRNIEPGRYELQADPPPPWYLASASCGNVDLMRDPLVIGVGIAPCTIHAVLHNDCASLKWSIAPPAVADASDHQGGTGRVSVIAIPLGNLTQSAKFAGSQRPATAGSPAQGSFEHLAPGRYLIIALQHLQELPYRDAAALERYLPRGKEVTLTANAKSEVQLDMVAGEL
jgi:hypothetical protein